MSDLEQLALAGCVLFVALALAAVLERRHRKKSANLLDARRPPSHAALLERIKALESLAQEVLLKGRTQMAAIDDLTAQVTSNVSVEGSAATLLSNISAQLTAALASNNTAAIEQIAATLKTSAAALTAAIVANTPAAPPPPAPAP